MEEPGRLQPMGSPRVGHDWATSLHSTSLHFAQTHVHWASDAIQPSHPLFSPSLPLNLAQHQSLFQWVYSSHQVAKYYSFSLNSPSSEYSGLVSFRMEWFDLLGVQGTLKSLLQHHSSKVSILRSSAFFTVQLSHPYMTTGNQKCLRNIFENNFLSFIFLMQGVVTKSERRNETKMATTKNLSLCFELSALWKEQALSAVWCIQFCRDHFHSVSLAAVLGAGSVHH